MGQGLGRNDPCPCGSGKKYKKCCLPRDVAQRGEVSQSGSDPRPPSARRERGPGNIYYKAGAADMGYGCWPSVSCFRQAVAGREDELVWAMVHQGREFHDRKDGLRAAEAELEVAFSEGVASQHETMAKHLGNQGFTSVTDFHVAPDWNTDRKTVLGDQHVEPIGEAAAQADPELHAMVMRTVDNQLAENDPPETRRTMQRLMQEGHPQELCRRLIGLVVAVELTDEFLFKKPFNRERFVTNLGNLPEVPPPPFPLPMGGLE